MRKFKKDENTNINRFYNQTPLRFEKQVEKLP